MTRLLELRGVVEAAPDAVAEILLDVRPGGASPLVTDDAVESWDGTAGVLTLPGSRMTVTVERPARAVVVQSEWWYRAVTSVEPDPRGAQLVHRVFDVAEGNRWAVRFLSRGPVNAAPAAFRAHLEELGRRLHCAAWVIGD